METIKLNGTSNECWGKIPVVYTNFFEKVLFAPIDGALRQVKVIAAFYKFHKNFAYGNDESTMTLRINAAGRADMIDIEMPLLHLRRGVYYYMDSFPKFFQSVEDYKNGDRTNIFYHADIFTIVSQAMRREMREIAEVSTDRYGEYWCAAQWYWDGTKAVSKGLEVPAKYVACRFGMCFEEDGGHEVTMPNGAYPSKETCEGANEVEVVCFEEPDAEEDDAQDDDEKIRQAIINSIENDTSVHEQEVSPEKMIEWLRRVS